MPIINVISGGGASGSLVYRGTWDATNNLTAPGGVALADGGLVDGSPADEGDYYIVNVAGTTSIDGVNDWAIGDRVVLQGGLWAKDDRSPEASGVSYDNTTSGLTATDVQEAIDEVVAGGVTKVGTPVDNQVGVWTGDGTLEGDANLTWDGSLLSLPNARITSLNTGDNVITTDTDGDLQESGVTVEVAPTGGSGMTLVEYASAPVDPPAGFHWIERIDANNVKKCYYDGTQTYFVVLSV